MIAQHGRQRGVVKRFSRVEHNTGKRVGCGAPLSVINVSLFNIVITNRPYCQNGHHTTVKHMSVKRRQKSHHVISHASGYIRTNQARSANIFTDGRESGHNNHTSQITVAGVHVRLQDVKRDASAVQPTRCSAIRHHERFCQNVNEEVRDTGNSVAARL